MKTCFPNSDSSIYILTMAKNFHFSHPSSHNISSLPNNWEVLLYKGRNWSVNWQISLIPGVKNQALGTVPDRQCFSNSAARGSCSSSHRLLALRPLWTFNQKAHHPAFLDEPMLISSCWKEWRRTNEDTLIPLLSVQGQNSWHSWNKY